MKPMYTLLCFFLFATVNAHNFTVGDKNGWTYGFDYTNWVASIPGGLLAHDNLVFKYQRGYDVYLLPTDIKFENCDFEGAKLIAGEREGGGDGFSFKLEACRKYYFACGVADGKYCKQGMMKFPVYAQGNCS
ncbi:hypothetical protein SUGI_0406340 [Cryptomeria japonica]|nr:hypothetical protein SUGI_0406340 [Cryptomeria japonica]